MVTLAYGATWAIAGLSTAGVIARPMRWPEWIWAVTGAVLLILLGLMPMAEAGQAVAKGLDVYLFLIGMMLLSETAREHGAFDWIAATAVNMAGRSRAKLFALVYATGVVVTTFMSNDATAVVLTPAVFVAAKKAKADPLPLLFACALIANAASFVLPISNPANLVLYGGHMPPLGAWMAAFALPSLASILVTFAVLRFTQRARIAGSCECDVERAPLSNGGRLAIAGIVLTAVLLLIVSALDVELGLPTALAGIATAVIVSLLAGRSPWTLARHVSWGVLPLVAGLFVLVEALDRTGVIAWIAGGLRDMLVDPTRAAAVSGTTLAFVSNLMNNLPAGLIASSAIAQAQPPQIVTDALLIGVDLGPNLSVTGSLATILWLQAIRREGEDVSFLAFLKVGAVAMPLALVAALGMRLLIG
ncbi:arsenic transporter [Sphingomonas paucimobilis]|uniref:Arsenic transporter n=2 Tax=Sphingomonas paucimobilis TaxID=13689 RepID=A0A411LJA8_SPHPI|nr:MULTISPECIES: arsenic transporter [Sphingomonas]MBQ1479044.1 arsenic transporter [Sphingomonas sp.]MCM3678537.1 arsenic transporter [Sphingomonas paucimobilis]MDG5969564.1 arsenic transporter [Sphingomonas paucimobilis]NNG59478.1 arsenic transporter [Sphingomonas paucimobilis]QBE92426.1 arsenic transporter [Sphingomonas paucimobilis]